MTIGMVHAQWNNNCTTAMVIQQWRYSNGDTATEIQQRRYSNGDTAMEITEFDGKRFSRFPMIRSRASTLASFDGPFPGRDFRWRVTGSMPPQPSTCRDMIACHICFGLECCLISGGVFKKYIANKLGLTDKDGFLQHTHPRCVVTSRFLQNSQSHM